MSSVFDKLLIKGLIKPPSYLKNNVCYEVITGSIAYGCNTNTSDQDIYGFAIPPKDVIWPVGEIPGFGTQKKRFEQFSQHHIEWSQDLQYDMTMYNIVKYFDLCMNGNPNMVDTLFVPNECVVYSNQIGQLVRQNRQLFLSKKCKHTFGGYAYSQLHVMSSPKEARSGKRLETYERYGFDTKFAYHLVRLTLECEQILTEGDIDLRRHKELYKTVRRGEWPEQKIREWFAEKEKTLDNLYESSTIRYAPDETAIKDLLLECLEHHYGSLNDVVERVDRYKVMIEKIKGIIDD